MKFTTSSAIIALTAATAMAAPADDVKLDKRTFGLYQARCDTGAVDVQVNQAVTNGLFSALNLGTTLLGLATQCNNQILANQAKYSGGSATTSDTYSGSGGSSSDNTSSDQSSSGSYGSSSAGKYSGSSGSSSGQYSGSSGSGSGTTYGSTLKTPSYGGSSGSSGSYGSSGSSSQYSTPKLTYGSTGSSSSYSSGYTFQTQRQQFTQNLVTHMKQQYPNYAVVACIPGSYSFSGTPVQKQTVQCSTSAGSVNYDVLVYTKGTFNLKGQGGFQNWAYVPNASCKYTSTQVAC